MTRGELKNYLFESKKHIGCFYDIDEDYLNARFILLNWGVYDEEIDVYITSIGLDMDDFASECMSPQQAMNEGLTSFDQLENMENKK